jgi:predicted phosphodiesterase
MNNMPSEESVLHLGDLDEPVLVFGGPYSNLEATRALLDIAQERSIPPDRLICTGDVVAYCANPLETVSAVRESGAHVVMGNCEESLGFQLDDCGCGFEEDTACDILSRQWYCYADSLLDDDARTWMRTRPRYITARMAGRTIGFIHGSTSDISGWIFESTDDHDKTKDLDVLSCDAIIAGHCGIPFAQVIADGRLWVNAGVIGMPANDGTQRGWFATITPENGTLNIQVESLHFDAPSAARAMRNAHLSEAYAKGLETGLWPNMDVLPESEKITQGIEIKEKNIIWPVSSQNAA